MNEDEALRMMLKKKHLELRWRLLAEKLREKHPVKVEQPDPEKMVRKVLDSTGLKVLSALKRQYPREARVVIAAIAKAIAEGRITGQIDGGTFYRLLLNLGLRPRLETKIYVERRGEVKEFSEYIREKIKNSQ